MAPPLLVLALDVHRAPFAFRHLSDPQRPLPEPFGTWLAEANAALAPSQVEATAAALGTTAADLRDAYLFLLRQMLLSPQADHYRVLGLARECSAEDIKHHHGSLVRLFHPDRFPDRLQDDGERSVALTARINHAYQVLRDPEARRRYDLSLPPLAAAEASSRDPAQILRPRPTVVPAARRVLNPVREGQSAALLRWALAAGVLAAVLSALVYEPAPPTLRVNPELGKGVPSGPAYMSGRAGGGGGESQGPGAAAHRANPAAASGAAPDASPAGRPAQEATRGAAPVPAATAAAPERQVRVETAPSRLADREPPAPREAKAPAPEQRVEAPPPDAGARRTAAASRETSVAISVEPPPVEIQAGRKTGDPASKERQARDDELARQAAARLVGRAQMSFANGDMAGLVSLFAANAVVNQGVGEVGILNAYWRLVKQSDERRMLVSGLSWQPGRDQRLVGRGTIRISTRQGADGPWTDLAGTLDVEVVPAKGGYRISKWIHHLSPR